MNQLAVIENNVLSLKQREDDMKENIRKYCIPDNVTVSQYELEHFAQICLSRNLNPLARHIYFTPIWDSKKNKNTAIPVISIDGMRSLAEETGTYAGQTLPLFCGKDGVWKELWTENTPPFACKIGIFRKDFSHPTFVIAKWDSYVKKDKNGGISKFWSQYPEQMISKCAESLGLRKTCPQKLSGIYSEDELDNNTIDVKIEEPKKLTKSQSFKPDSETIDRVEKMFDITNQFKEKEEFFNDGIERNIAVFCGDLGFSNDELIFFKKEVFNSFKEFYIKNNGSYDLDEHFANKLLSKRIRTMCNAFNLGNDMKYAEHDMQKLRKAVWDKFKANSSAKLEDVFLAESALLMPF